MFLAKKEGKEKEKEKQKKKEKEKGRKGNERKGKEREKKKGGWQADMKAGNEIEFTFYKTMFLFVLSKNALKCLGPHENSRMKAVCLYFKFNSHTYFLSL